VTFHWIGVVAAAAAFVGIWFGHVGVRKIEAASPTIWLPTVIALGLGLALEIGALLTANLYLSSALGIVGMTVLFDALEFTRQHNRVAHGHAPANPNNPRHARLLAAGEPATTLNWLDREPAGRPIKPEARLPHAEGAK
jgi:uncharacterized protein DUF4491